MLPGEAENAMNRSAKSVKRFERSNGLDTALYKNYLFFTVIASTCHFSITLVGSHRCRRRRLRGGIAANGRQQGRKHVVSPTPI